MGADFKSGLTLLVCLLLVAIPAGLAVAAVWLLIRAPELLILGVILLVIFGTLVALVGNIGQRRRG